MTMTAKQKPQFIVDRGQSRVEVHIGGQYVPLRKTVHQIEQYEAMEAIHRADREAKKDAPANGAAVLRHNFDQALDVAVVALNPKPGDQPWPREKISDALDADEIELLAQVWLAKLFVPRMEQDPRLAPREGGA